MMRLKFIYLLITIILISLLAGCGTEEKIYPDKPIPTDSTISIIQQENYLQKAYISLLGRKPDSTEIKNQIALFAKDNCGKISRIDFIKKLTLTTEFGDQLYKILCRDLLQETDTTAMHQLLRQYQQDLERTTNEEYIITLKNDIEELKTLIQSQTNLKSQNTSIAKVYRQFVNNNIYDEINMGSENFVISIFSNFLYRYPTVDELKNSIQMVERQNGFLFGSIGGSRNEFLDLFFNNLNFKEGQVRYYFKRFLLREPTTQELFTYIPLINTNLEKNQDHIKMYLEIMTMDEYIKNK